MNITHTYQHLMCEQHSLVTLNINLYSTHLNTFRPYKFTTTDAASSNLDQGEVYNIM